MQKTIPINIPLFDSITIDLPISKIEILDNQLTDQYYKYYLGEEQPRAEVHEPSPMTLNIDGLKTRIGFKNRNEFKKDSHPIKCLSYTITTKFLKQNYFYGLNPSNIHQVYTEIMEQNIFYCSFETFLQAYWRDTDICINRYSSTPQCFLRMLEDLKNQAGTKEKFFNLFPYIEDKNLGLDINKREKSKPSTPYIKFYHKEFELVANSNEFYNNYLKRDYSQTIKNLTRVEATIRNAAHKKRLVKKGIISKYETLGDLLQMPNTEKLNFVKSSLNEYIVKIKRVKSENLTPMEHLLFECFQNQIQLGYDYKAILKIAETFQGQNIEHTKKSKYRLRKQINKIFDLTIHKSEILKEKSEQNTEVNEYLNFLGINLK